MERNMNSEMHDCIDACQACHNVCLQAALGHCLEMGGKAEPEHFRLMIDCAEMCQASANLMLSESRFHSQSCQLCAEICEACADSCTEIGKMDECVQTCRRCAHGCRKMAAVMA